jgi:hypothetical protein
MSTSPTMKPVAKFGFPASIKLYANGMVEVPGAKKGHRVGSAIGATARVEQSGSKRLVRDTRQSFLIVEGPRAAITVKLRNDASSTQNARKFAASFNRVAMSHQAPSAQAPSAQAPAAASMSDELGRLVAMHENGTLTDGEFTQAKAAVIARAA